MQEEFEKKVRERLHTFGIQPSREVWEDIDVVLNKQKHRRVFVGWWILLGLVIMGGAVLLVDKSSINQNRLNQLPVTTSDTANADLAEILKPRKQADQVSVNQLNYTPKQKSNNTHEPLIHEERFAGNNKIAAGDRNNAKLSSINSAFSFSKKMPGISQDTLAKKVADGENKTDVTPRTVAKHTNAGYVLNAFTPAAVTAQAPPVLHSGADTAAKPVEILRDTSVTAASPEKEAGQNQPAARQPKTIMQKKHEWYLMLSAGTTQSVSSGGFNTSLTTGSLGAANPLYASIPAITSLNLYNDYNNISHPKTGFHISAVAVFERSLSPHWKISGGLGFSYLSNTQQTGGDYKNPLYVTAASGNYNVFSLNTPLVTLQSYYQSGTTYRVVNKAWQAEMPLGVSFVFNPKSKTKFLLNAGVSYAWLFSSQWLIPDARYDKLYYSKAVFNNTSFNWQAGPAVQLSNQWRFGLQYQQSFTTLAKDYVMPQLHWQNISIYTAIPLGRKKGAGKRRGMAFW